MPYFTNETAVKIEEITKMCQESQIHKRITYWK